MTSESTTAAVLCGIKDIKLVERRIEPPKENEVQVRVEAVGICGSDLAYWATGIAGGFKHIDFSEKGLESGYRGQMGHECAGTIVKLGANVQDLKLGDRVALEPGVPCSTCKICRKGRYNLCSRMKFIGSAVNETPGALAKVFNHPVSYCYKLPKHISVEEGAMFEPLCVALHAVTRAEVGMGDKILITGAGPIGLLTALASKAAGAGKPRVDFASVNLDDIVHITISDMVDAKLVKAKGIGVEETVKANAPNLEKELSMKFDKCFECSGAQPALELCIKSATSGGKVCVVANVKEVIPTRIQELARREVDLIGIYRYCNLYPVALDLVATGMINLKPLITKSFQFVQTQEAFEYFATGEPIKVIINPNE